MVKKKKSVKKKVSVKPMIDSKMKDKCNCKYWTFGKLGAMAFILFLITVWPDAMELVHTIHWGWFLGATVLFCIIHCLTNWKNMCKM